jgi:hypothetical protein
MRACEVVEGKKRKRTTLGPTGGSSSSAPLKYKMVLHTTRGIAAPTSVVLGKPLAVSAIAVAAAVHLCSIHSAAPGGS